MRNSSFLDTQTILTALQYTLDHGGFGKNGRYKKAAEQLIKHLHSNRSLGGRHALVVSLLKKGASVQEMMSAAGASRRTVFRYLNHIEDSGITLELRDGRYRFKE